MRTPLQYSRYLMDSYKKNRKTFIVLTVLHIMVILTLIRCIIKQQYESVFTCVLALLLFLLPALIEDKMKLEIPPLFEAIIFLFIFAAEILGEVDHYYTKIHGWDTMLHTINGFLFAAVGFSLIYLLNRGSTNFNLSPFYLALMAFCVSMTVGVIWEFFECSMDIFFLKDMQKDFFVDQFATVSLNEAGDLEKIKGITDTVINTESGKSYSFDGFLDIGIRDTMKDLLVNMIGAIVFCTIGYISLKNEKSSKVADSLAIRPKTE